MRRDRQKIVRQGWLIIGTVIVAAVVLVVVALWQFGFFAGPGPVEGEVTEQSPPSPALGRKNIYDRNGKEMAVSFRLTSIYARPLEIKDIDGTVTALAKGLGLKEGELRSLFRAERSFVWLDRKLPAAQAEKVLDLELPGIYGIDEMVRFYPHRQEAAQVLGFVKDDQGLAGVEFSYDNVLRGSAGRDAELANIGLDAGKPGTGGGADLVLTIDLQVQSLLEQQLEKLAAKTDAAAGAAIIANTVDGAVVAMASLPTYDPNRFWEYAAPVRRNRAVTDQVFPGGLTRLFQAGAIFQQQGELIDGEAEEAPWVVVGKGEFVSSQLAALPLWQGAAAPLDRFVDRLGVNAKTGIDLPDEQGEGLDGTGGGVQPLRIGEVAVSASALRLLNGFTTLLNDGMAVRPHLLDAIRNDSGMQQVKIVGRSAGAGEMKGIGEAVARALGGVTASGQRRGFVVESLVEETLMGSRTALDETTGAEITEQGAPAAGASAAAAELPPRYYATMLGMTPAAGANLAMIVSLSGARFDTAASSPMRAMGQQVLRQAVVLSGKGAGLPAAIDSGKGKSESYYQAWRKLQPEPATPQVAATTPLAAVMPSVVGYSLRKALQTLQPYGLPISVEGSGRVVGQRPAAGKALNGSKEMVLKLQMDQ